MRANRRMDDNFVQPSAESAQASAVDAASLLLMARSLSAAGREAPDPVTPGMLTAGLPLPAALRQPSSQHAATGQPFPMPPPAARLSDLLASLPATIAEAGARPAATGQQSPIPAPLSAETFLPPLLEAAPTASSTLPVVLEPIPAALTRHSRTTSEVVREPVWPAVTMTIALAGALVVGGMLAMGELQTNIPQSGRVSAAASGEPQVVAAPPRLRAGPVVMSRLERETIQLADTLLAEGDVPAAQEVLARLEDTAGPETLLRLAETYDPNVINEVGGMLQSADAHRARELYQASLALGDNERARRRLRALSD